MTVKEKIQREIDEICEWGYCNFSETYKVLCEAKEEIERLEQLKQE